MRQSGTAGLDSRRLIVLIHSDHPNDAETAKPKRQALAEYGYTVEEISYQAPDAAQTLATLLQQRASEVFCFISDNFSAAKIRDQNKRMLHQITGIPMVFYLHDHPAHFAEEWTPAVNGGIVFAPGVDLIDFIHSTYGLDTLGVVNAAFFPPQVLCGKPEFEDFVARENVILCPMNLALWGLPLDQLWQRIKQLPPPRSRAAKLLAEAALTEWRTPLHVIAQSLDTGLSAEETKAHVGDQFLVLNFLKLWRRNAMVRSLIDLPILVSTEYVPADLEFKYPQKFTLLSIAQTTPLYRQHRFVLNAFPLLVNAMHERVFSSLCSNSVLITDRNVAVTRYLKDESEVVYFDYEDADMAAKVSRYIEDPVAAFEITKKAYEVRQNSDLKSTASFGDLIEAVKQRWAEQDPPKNLKIL